MGRIEKSIEIKAPPEKVWEMLAFDRMPEWMDEWKSAEYTSEVRTPEDKFGVGASAHVTEKHGKLDLEITEILGNEKITARSKRPVNMTLRYILKPVGEGTELTYVMDYEMPWSVLGKIPDKLFVRRALEKDIEGELENLKSVLEK